jgi:hypothetical protein
MRSVPVAAALLLVAGGVAACGSDDDSADPTPSTGSAESTEAAPSSEAGEPVVRVVFDGDECTADGPPTVTVGEHSFLFIDDSERPRTEMWVRHLAEGSTYQDLVDLLEEAGGQGTYIPHPPFVEPVPMVRPESSTGDGQHQYDHLIVESGSYALVVGGDDGVWTCGTFDVVDA